MLQKEDVSIQVKYHATNITLTQTTHQYDEPPVQTRLPYIVLTVDNTRLSAYNEPTVTRISQSCLNT